MPAHVQGEIVALRPEWTPILDPDQAFGGTARHFKDVADRMGRPGIGRAKVHGHASKPFRGLVVATLLESEGTAA